ncbi:MAG: hypothetical protein JWP51_3633 [Bradyrhizobium sp.]|nr:hypothetical protein [Bradyrhizobium sp.]
MIVAADDNFVVPVPTTLRAIGFFRADRHPSIASDARDNVARKLADASSGWNAIAVGAAGRPGLALKARNEQDAVNEAPGQLRQARQRLPCHRDRPVCGRAELSHFANLAKRCATVR